MTLIWGYFDCRMKSAYAVNSEHGLVVVDDKYIAFFRPNLYFLPHIWAKIVCYIKIIVYLCTKILSIWKD